MLFIGELSALITAFLWSGSSIVFASATLRIGSLQVNINRMIFAVCLLLITILLSGLDVELSFWQIFYLAISGIVGLVFGDTFLFKAFQHIGARLSMLLLSLAPAIAALLAYVFLNESLSILGIFGILVTLIGIGIVVFERNETPSSRYKISKIGILFGLLAAIGQGTGLVFAKVAFEMGEINGFVATFIRVLFSLLLLMPAAMLARKFKNPVKIFSNDKKSFWLVLAGAMIGPFLGITFSLIAIAHTKVGIASTIMATVPVVMLPMVRFIYKEKLSSKAVIGAFLAVIGVAVLFLI